MLLLPITLLLAKLVRPSNPSKTKLMPYECGIDPIDFRLMNGVKEGDPQTAGPPFKRIGYMETLQAIKDSEHYKSKLEGPNRGRGLGAGFWFIGLFGITGLF